MIVKGSENIDLTNRSVNCRIQAITDLLALKNINVSPHLLLLCAIDSLYLFSNIEVNGLNYPFVSCFLENVEYKLFSLFGNTTILQNVNIFSKKDLTKELDNGNAILVLCDANSILKKAKNISNKQFGVCSGLLLIGHKTFSNNILTSNVGKDKEFCSIPYRLLRYARNCIVLPSSPNNMAMKLSSNEFDLQKIKVRLNDENFYLRQVKKWLSSLTNEGNNVKNILTNNGIVCHKDNDAINELLKVFDIATEIYYDEKAEEEIRLKYISIMFKVLRKAMLSGTSTFYREEISRGLLELHTKCQDKRILALSKAFHDMGILFRDVIRRLYAVDELKKSGINYINGLKEKLISIIGTEKNFIRENII